jgi:hypothetical protein
MEDYCVEQSQTKHGSSKFFKSSWDSFQYISYIASDDCHDNPEFCTWNKVTNSYCSEDLHSGQVTTPTEKTWGLYFAGHFVNEAILTKWICLPINLQMLLISSFLVQVRVILGLGRIWIILPSAILKQGCLVSRSLGIKAIGVYYVHSLLIVPRQPSSKLR